MAKLREIRESGPKQKQGAGLEAGGRAEFCAYNLTGKRFVSNCVAVVDALASDIKRYFDVLGPGSASAVWIVPIRRLMPLDFCVPVDLLYLDEECKVVALLESYPIRRDDQQFAEAASILALPARSATVAAIEPGNRLLICAPDKMQEYLLNPQSPVVEPMAGPQLVIQQDPGKDSQKMSEVDDTTIWKWADQLERAEAVEPEARPTTPKIHPDDSAGAMPEPSSSATSEPAPYTPPKKTFWEKLLRKKSTDPRKAPRFSLPGLVAYFFTGSAPVAHRVHNLSTSGLYVFTSERWYPGTVVRITLTDERNPVLERSITVHASVIRATEDGVALQFVRRDANLRPGRVAVATLDPLIESSSAEQVEMFIQRFERSV